jgi:FtsZ-interacting cell division protein YlmF
MDFISGSTYALEGHVKTVSKKVYIFAPNNISFENNEGQKNW